jgi:hypothetical protein
VLRLNANTVEAVKAKAKELVELAEPERKNKIDINKYIIFLYS